jgi:hypothetical protein
MKNQRDKLHQYQKRITVLTSREKEIAKECLTRGDTAKAKLALRRKKFQESLLAKTDAQLAQLEVLTSDVEFALVQKDVLYGLQQGTSVLKQIHKEMGGIENVEKLMGESEEARAYQEVCVCCGWDEVGRIILMLCYRKLVRCWRTRCRTRTRMRWKMSWKLSRQKSTALNYPVRRTSSWNIHKSRRRRW